jgi:hypothetical protein
MQSDGNRRKEKKKKKEKIAILMELNVISLSYFKKISENLTTPSFHALSHHFQLIVLHIVAVMS